MGYPQRSSLAIATLSQLHGHSAPVQDIAASLEIIGEADALIRQRQKDRGRLGGIRGDLTAVGRQS